MAAKLLIHSPSGQLICALQKWHCPKVLIVSITVILRFFPTIAEEFRSIKSAMLVRGIPLNVKNSIIYMYVRAKVPRKGSVLLMCTLVALIAFCLGITWPSALGLFIGGIFAELISAVGKYTSKLWNLIGYIVFICGFWLGQAFYMIFGTEMFMNSMVRQGTDLEFAQSLVDFVSGPMFIVCLLATIVLSAIGGALGYVLFKKHFSKLEA